MVNWTNPEATDNSKQNPTVTCDVESGSHFGIGVTQVQCQAVDASGNHASCVFTVKVDGKMICIILDIICAGSHNFGLMR